jgi:hypothetical protein
MSRAEYERRLNAPTYHGQVAAERELTAACQAHAAREAEERAANPFRTVADFDKAWRDAVNAGLRSLERRVAALENPQQPEPPAPIAEPAEPGVYSITWADGSKGLWTRMEGDEPWIMEGGIWRRAWRAMPPIRSIRRVRPEDVR